METLFKGKCLKVEENENSFYTIVSEYVKDLIVLCGKDSEEAKKLI